MFKIPFKFILQKILGFENYLFAFAVISVYRLQFTYYDREFLHFLKMLPENGDVLDLGSNVGTMSVMMAKRVKRGTVFTFEPIPLHVRILKKVFSKFKVSNVEIFETALGNSTGEITMIMPVIYHVKFHGFSHVVENGSVKPKGDFFRVSERKLDDFSELKNLAKIDAIKIDVENFEFPILKGAEKLLKQHRPLIYCELWDNEKRKLTISYLQNDLGYQVKIFKKNQLVIFSGQQTTNFFFIP